MPKSTQVAVVVRERTLDATPEEVWETLTDEALLPLWLAADVELDLRVGGRARFEFEDGETRDGEIEALQPPERLTWSWWDETEQRQRVEFRLLPAGSGTRLVVTETRAGSRYRSLGLSALAGLHSPSLCA